MQKETVFAQTGTQKTLAALRWDIVDAGGWQYLLAALPAARVLCYDTGTDSVALLLATLCRELVVVHADPVRRREIDAEAAQLGLKNLRTQAPHELLSDPALSKNNTFDGFVLHDPQARIVNRDKRAELTELFLLLQRALHPGAFAYFGVRHRYGYDRLRALLRARTGRSSPMRLWSVPGFVRRLHAAGFAAVRSTPVLLTRERVAEIIPARGYSSVKNRFLRAEQIKELVLGRVGANWFAPFYSLVAYRHDHRPSYLEQLLHYLRSQDIDGVPRRGQLALKRYLVLNGGKVILSLGTDAARGGDIIVVMVHDAESAQRREREGEVLKTLAHLPARLSARIPKLLHSMTFLGVRCFVLSELPGVTVDAPTPRLQRITANAAQFLADLHHSTQEACQVSASTYPVFVGDLFDAARQRYPAFLAEWSSLETLLRQAILGRELPCVRFHGDYKIENVMVNKVTDEVTGVIDWELSRSLGLPLLDLLYLLIYNRMINGAPWFSAFQDVGLRSRRDLHEQKLWDEYLQRIPIAPGLVPVLGVLFVLHHIGCRHHIDLQKPGRKQEMHDMIHVLAGVLQKTDTATAAQQAGALDSGNHDKNRYTP